MTKQKLANKSNRVYEVGIATLNSEEDIPNWTSFTIVAIDVIDAMEKVNPKLKTNEYVEEVKLITVLDE